MARKAGRLLVEVFMSDKFSRKFAKVSKSVSSVGKNFDRIGKTATTRVTAPALLAGGAIARVGFNFDKAMNTVEAKGKLGVKTFDDLRKEAELIGSTTRNTAVGTAEAMAELSGAGLDTGQIFKSIRPVLNLAAVSTRSAAEEGEFLTDVMNSMGVPFEKAADIAAKLAVGTSAGSVKMVELQEAMKMATSDAKGWGDELPDVIAMTVALADAGVKGTMAGTGLSQAYLNLAQGLPRTTSAMKKLDVSVDDAEGKTRKLPDILQDIADKTKHMDPGRKKVKLFMDIFGVRGGKAMAKLVDRAQQSDRSLKDLINTVRTAGTPEMEKMIKTLEKGSVGPMFRFMSSIEGLGMAISRSGFLGALSELAETTAKFINKLSQANPEVIRMATKVIVVVAVLGPLLAILGKVVIGVGTLITVFSKIPMVLGAVKTGFLFLSGALIKIPIVASIATKGLLFLKAAFVILTGPVGWVIGAIAAMGAAIYAVRKKTGSWGKTLKFFGGLLLKNLLQPINLSINAIRGLLWAASKIPGGVGRAAGEGLKGLSELQDKMNVALTGSKSQSIIGATQELFAMGKGSDQPANTPTTTPLLQNRKDTGAQSAINRIATARALSFAKSEKENVVRIKFDNAPNGLRIDTGGGNYQNIGNSGEILLGGG